jgi:hypothetical protein
MECGTILEGFVSEMDDVYLKLVENDNIEVIIKMDDISVARLNGKQVSEMSSDIQGRPLSDAVKIIRSKNDFSMDMPRVSDESNVYSPPKNHIPSFERNTVREDKE